MAFSEKLRRARKDRGLSQEQLAEMLDVSRQSVSNWESDEGYPEMKKAILLASKLEVTLDMLFCDELALMGLDTPSALLQRGMDIETNDLVTRSIKKEYTARVIESMCNPKKEVFRTGFSFLDNRRESLGGPSLRLLYGYTCIGKTTFLLNIVANVMAKNGKVLYITRRDSTNWLLKRLIGIIAGVDNAIGAEYSKEE